MFHNRGAQVLPTPGYRKPAEEASLVRWLIAALYAVAIVALVEIGVFICAQLGYAFAFPAGICVVWPPAGFVLAILLLLPYRQWPLVVAGAMTGSFAALLLHDANPATAFAGSLASAIESTSAAWVVLRFARRPIRLSTARELLAVIIGGALISNTATALFGALALSGGLVMPFGWAWFVSWIGDGLGMVIVAPGVIATAGLLQRTYSWRRLLETAALLAVVTAGAWLLLGGFHLITEHTHPYMLLPILFFVAARLGPAGAAAANLCVAAVAVWFAALGLGPFTGDGRTYTDTIVLLYAFLGLTALCGLGAAVILGERHAAQADLRASLTEKQSLEAQFRQAQKMEPVGQLAGGVAHDFNNILTAILGYAELLSDAIPETDERRSEVDEITRAAQRAAGLTQQLLAFSRQQVLEPKVLQLGTVVDGLAPMLRRLLGEQIDLRAVVNDEGFVKVDGGQIEQVLMNLAVNARDAMPSGGRLTVETGDAGAYAFVAVTDTGHGMSPETRERIFEPFFTTKPEGLGTGLGLSVVQGIVKQSGGHLWVYSELGHGTTFKVFLPRTDATSEESVMQATPAPSGTEAILLIEDDDAVRRFVQRVLASRGYRVHPMGTPSEALSFLSATEDPVDIVLTDVVLPEMSGPALALKLRTIRPALKVLFVSGYADGALAHQELLAADMAFLQKPFSGSALLSRVRGLLDETLEPLPLRHPEGAWR